MVFEREAAAAPILQGDSGTRHFSDACVRGEHFAKVPDSSTSANPSKFAGDHTVRTQYPKEAG